MSRLKIFTLSHPDLNFGSMQALRPPEARAPLRLLFMGRIMPYKGLGLFLDTVEILRKEGLTVELGVFGEGALGDCAERLSAMGAEVVNRWLSKAEIAALLPRFHTMVLSHVEASQSGVAATALGAGLPIVATPVGGLIEQIQDGQTGILAARADAPALAQAIKRLLLDPQLYQAICMKIQQTGEERSMRRFVENCVSHALQVR